MIYEIRGKQVILDSDVAYLYDYETKRINEAVRRNIKRFPESFCFQLTKEEYDFLECHQNISSRSQFVTLDSEENLRSQIATANNSMKRFLPYVFTEQGIAMLSGLLKNDVAIEVSINIMNAFVEMRKFILNNTVVFEKLAQHDLKLSDLDINKFNKQYPKLNIKYSENYHDRFIIIDNKTLYHCGASLKDLGKSAFAINKMEDKTLIDNLLNKI